MSLIKIGFIGAGKIARVHHLPAIAALKGRALGTAIYDLSADAARRLQSECLPEGVVAASVEELIASGIDAAIVSTPNSTHHPLTTALLNAGIHVLVEKPMASSLEEADEMIELAGRKGLVLQVNQTLRFHRDYALVKALITQGAIGQPLHLRCIRASTTSPDKGWSPGAKWFLSKAANGGVVWDIAVHMADLMQWYFGPVKKIASVGQSRIAEGDVIDHIASLFEFDNGATGILELSWNFPRATGLLEIYGETGVVRFGFSEKGGIELSRNGEAFTPVESNPVRNAHEAWIDAIEGKEPTPVCGIVGRNAIALCLAMETAAISGAPVHPDLLSSDR